MTNLIVHIPSWLLLLALAACTAAEKPALPHLPAPEERDCRDKNLDSLESGQSYLSVYSEIYSANDHRTHELTATISLRNTSQQDTLFLLSATYFDTHGKHIRYYLLTPIYLLPMETAEIVLDENAQYGGTGANFIFDWKKTRTSPEPLFEAIMISTSGQQGLSFGTQGKRIK